MSFHLSRSLSLSLYIYIYMYIYIYIYMCLHMLIPLGVNLPTIFNLTNNMNH